MNDPELDTFENDLKRLNPATAPDELVAKLISARPAAPTSKRSTGASPEKWGVAWRRLLWVLAPGCTALVILAAVMVASRPGGLPPPAARQATRTSATDQQTVTPAVSQPADQLEIDRYLVASFETVAETAEKGPIRLRFDQWLETVTFRDPETGIAVERHIPRLQVVPVRFETY